MKLFSRLVVLAAVALNAAVQLPAHSAETEPPPVNSALDADLFNQLLVGEIHAASGQPGEAYLLIIDAARRTNDAALYQRAVELALQARSGDSAVEAARAWRQAQPESRDAHLYLLQILIALNRIAETGEPLQAVIARTPIAERPGVIASLPRLYSRTQERQLAGGIVERALAGELKQPATAAAAWATVGRMRLHTDDVKGAWEAAQRAHAAGPQAEDPVLLALELMERNQTEAEAVVRQHLASGNVRPPMRMAYAQVLIELDRDAEALEQLQHVTTQTPDLAQAWLMQGSLQAQDKPVAAEAALQRYLALTEAQQTATSEEAQRGSVQAYLMLAQIAEKRGDFSAAEGWLGRIENASEIVGVQSRRASMLARQGKLKEARRLLDALPERNPEEARLKVMAQLQLLRDNKQPRRAYELVAKAVARSPNDTDLIYEQALLAEKIGRPDEMERLLRRVIAINPEHHHAYNALGYSLADRNLRLGEARELVTKALALAPNDPFIQDSLGWVEFRQGNKTEALRLLEAAYKLRPDPEIAAHLGEVLWSLGQRDRATAIWREGLLANGGNETLTQTLRRLHVRP